MGAISTEEYLYALVYAIAYCIKLNPICHKYMTNSVFRKLKRLVYYNFQNVNIFNIYARCVLGDAVQNLKNHIKIYLQQKITS